MESFIGIYQPYYKPALIERLDRGFIALDWLSNPTPALRELALHHHMAVQKIYSRHHLTGLLSPKFFAKTKLRSQQVYDWIADNPGHDIYLINGLPYITYANYNDIERSKLNNHAAFESGPGVLQRDGLELPEEFPRQTHANLCACNYWVASPSFWERWAKEVVSPIFETMAVRKPTDELLGYAKHRVRSSVYQLTFVYERLIDYYIAQNKIDAIYYPWTAQGILSLDYQPTIEAYLKEMIPLVDRLDKAGSWSERDRVWLQERYAAVRLGTSGDDMLTSDPADYDLPKIYPTSNLNDRTL